MLESKIIVLKFGGSCIKESKDYLKIADIILNKKNRDLDVVVVVSAMNGVTDQLIHMASEIHENPPKREQDMLISIGERMSISLLAMALHKKGQEAVSFTGSQSGIITNNTHSNAQIVDVRPYRIVETLKNGKIAIVAGFQGMSREKEITTLGRGGSDTSAVALAIALQASRVEFFKDVMGIYDKDPKKHSESSLQSELNYKQAYKLAKAGATVMHSRAIQLAMENSIELWIEHFDSALEQWQNKKGTIIRGNGEKALYASYEREEVYV